MARTLAQAGANVVVNGRDPAALAPVVAELPACGGQAHALAADLGDRAAVQQLIDHAVAWQGRLDILVNNAGIIRRTPSPPNTAAPTGTPSFA